MILLEACEPLPYPERMSGHDAEGGYLGRYAESSSHGRSNEVQFDISMCPAGLEAEHPGLREKGVQTGEDYTQ
jgi:hypothetical protein